MLRSTEGVLKPPRDYSRARSLEVLRALVSKELKVKYKRSVLGIGWSLVTPLALAGVYLFVFIYIYKVPKPEFILFLLSGLFPWNYFNMSILASTGSIVENGPLIRKMYFRREMLPVATVAANLINFMIGMSIFLVVLLLAGKPIWLSMHWLILAIALETILTVGVALLLSATNVYFRDIQQLISILTLVLFFGTPIVYELSQVPASFRPLILANPLSSIMEIFRTALVRSHAPSLRIAVLAVLEALLVFALGSAVFRKLSPTFAKEV